MAISVLFFDLGQTLVTSPRAWLPGAHGVLKPLKDNEIRLGIISNTGNLPDRNSILELLPVDFPLDQFESNLVLFSSEVGIEKPKEGIFLEALVRASDAPSRCVYCSEDLLETLVAQHVGMRTIRVSASPESEFAGLLQVLNKYDNETTNGQGPSA